MIAVHRRTGYVSILSPLVPAHSVEEGSALKCPTISIAERSASRAAARLFVADGPRAWITFAALVCAAIVALPDGPSRAAEDVADTALVMAVDISQSVDEARYRLQMEGIALALEDPDVIRTITGGPRRSIMFTLVGWADRARVLLPWTWIGSASDAAAVASMLRSLPSASGEYTCVARMMRHIDEFTLEHLPVKADRIVVDVSGDGADNCTSLTYLQEAKQRLVDRGVTINGLPILEDGTDREVERWHHAPGATKLDFPLPGKGDARTLPEWYERHVMAGPGAFVETANGYDDFARAIRRKFILEVAHTGASIERRLPVATVGGSTASDGATDWPR
ncbi:MAG: DUF1194 domain-containing protein [Hyphomicrobiaceae bacterium]